MATHSRIPAKISSALISGVFDALSVMAFYEFKDTFISFLKFICNSKKNWIFFLFFCHNFRSLSHPNQSKRAPMDLLELLFRVYPAYLPLNELTDELKVTEEYLREQLVRLAERDYILITDAKEIALSRHGLSSIFGECGTLGPISAGSRN